MGAAAPIIGLLGSVAGGVMQMRQAAAQQEEADRKEAFARQQAAAARLEDRRLREESARRIAEETRNINPDERLEDIQTGQEEIAEDFSRDITLVDPNVDAATALAPGAVLRGGDIVQTDLARRLAGAADAARGRVAGIAGLSSFGGDAVARGQEITRLGQDVDLLNTLRQDVLGTTRTNVGISNRQPGEQPSELGNVLAGAAAGLPGSFGGGGGGGTVAATPPIPAPWAAPAPAPTSVAFTPFWPGT